MRYTPLERTPSKLIAVASRKAIVRGALWFFLSRKNFFLKKEAKTFANLGCESRTQP
jgi:hypothetical protein